MAVCFRFCSFHALGLKLIRAVSHVFRLPESGAENMIAQVLAIILARPLIVSGFFLDYITGN